MTPIKDVFNFLLLYQTRTLKFDRLKSSRQSATVLLGLQDQATHKAEDVRVQQQSVERQKIAKCQEC